MKVQLDSFTKEQGVDNMDWTDLLKMYDGKKFLEELKEEVGGDIKGGYKKSGKGKGIATYFYGVLSHDRGSIKVQSGKGGAYTVRVNNQVVNVTPVYNLKDVIPMTKKAIDEFKKSEFNTFEKDNEEAALAANLSAIEERLKDAPKYIKTAFGEIKRYIQGE